MNFLRRKVANEDGVPAPKAEGKQAETPTPTGDNDTCNDPPSSVGVDAAVAPTGGVNGEAVVNVNGSMAGHGEGRTSEIDATGVAKDMQKMEMEDEDEDGASQHQRRLSTVSLTSNKDDPISPPQQPQMVSQTPATPKVEPGKENADDNDGEHDESEGEYTDDDDDDDSEYTYETESEDEGEQTKKKGWFGFLGRRTKQTHKEEEEEEYTESEEEDEGHSSEVIEVQPNDKEMDDPRKSPKEADITQPSQQQQEDEQSESSEEGPTHPLLQSPEPPSPETKQLLLNGKQPNSTTSNNEQEESILMAQAIQRVQQRIQNNGGNLYAALDEQDQRLVDSLQGVSDEEKIREVVDKSMEEDEKNKRKAEDTAAAIGGEAGGCDGYVNVDKETNVVNTIDIEPLAHTAPSSLNGDGSALEPPTLDREPSERMEPAAVDISAQPSLDKEPSLHTEPSLDTEASLSAASKSAPAESATDETTTNNLIMDEVEDETKVSDSEDEYSDDDDEGEDEMPTVEDQRSLLSLGAEHDRVDVIKELLNDSPLVESLLAGVQGDIEREEDGGDESQQHHVVFVPPPLHAAVAHGSINAASCLLRMGADPSIRPVVPAQFLSHSYQPSPSRGGAGEDRNYRKYHEMSAWELAFGATIEIIDGEDVDAVENELEMAVIDEQPKRGWFGFGASPKEEEPTTIVEKSPCGKKRIKRKSPVTIAPRKQEGIKHAFTAEALRAIGSDEVNRLSQLLNAGMDSHMEVAGKTLVEWAKEMDAHGCSNLLGAGLVEEEEQEEVEQVEKQTKAPDDSEDVAPEPVEEAAPKQPVTQPEIPQEPAFIPEERLKGMSITDIQMLVQENTNLIPTLTSCLADLTAETSINSSILQDVTSGGRGGISSPAFVDLVRALKDQRVQAEEASQSWQGAWEEREDELDFFWEEVVDDRMREELGPMLSQVSSDPMQQYVPPEMANSLEYWTKRFVEVDAHMNKLRVSIAQLAQDSANQTADIGKHGMSGALNLTKSIRDEIKEFERQLELAKSGEGMCRRKIEIIQSRIVHNDPNYNGQPDKEELAMPPVAGTVEQLQEQHPEQAPAVYCDEHTHPESEDLDVGMEDYQLRAIVQQQKESGEASSILPPAAVEHEVEHQSEVNEEVMTEGEHHEDLQYETTSDGEDDIADEGSVHEDTYSEEVADDTPDLSQPDINESSSGSYDIVEALDATNEVRSIHEAVEEEDVDKSGGESVDESNDIVEEEENVEVEQEEAKIEQPADVEKPREVQPTSLNDWNDNDIVYSSKVNRQSQEPANATAATSTNKPSDAITEGMSTAIVVHTPNLQASSLPSQIWEILRRIVGFGRVVRTERYDDNNNPHIMIV